jgi:hypothetical protein
MEYFKERWKQKRWAYVIDWTLDIMLAVVFIYMSLQVRGWMLRCTCPFCSPYNNTPFKIPITTVR